MSWKTMEEYEEDAEFKWIDPMIVDKNDASLWRTNYSTSKNRILSIKT